jgi:hypothetical protein
MCAGVKIDRNSCFLCQPPFVGLTVFFQVAVDTEHHLIVTHEVMNSASDWARLAKVAKMLSAAMQLSMMLVLTLWPKRRWPR